MLKEFSAKAKFFVGMKQKMKISKSTRIHIRREKARIRRGIADLEEQKKLIEKLYPNDH